jgi:hypothetical protein
MGRGGLRADPASRPREVVSVVPPPRTTVVESELSRPWTCTGCDEKIPKGTIVQVRVTVGAPHNAVFHLNCVLSRDRV